MDQRELIGDQEEALRAAISAFLLDTWTALPGIVQSFDPARQSCVVQVSVKFQQLLAQTPADGQNPAWVTMQPIPDVPVVFMGGGGFSLTFKPRQGDECLLIFASRCIDGWWQMGGIQLQPKLRDHSLSDGFCLIGPRSRPNVLTGISDNAQLRSNDGTTYLEIAAGGKINLVAPGGVKITGTLEVDGTILSTGEGTFNGIPVSTHLHTGVTTGASDTGGPIP